MSRATQDALTLTELSGRNAAAAPAADALPSWSAHHRRVIPDGPRSAIVVELAEIDGQLVLDCRRWFGAPLRPSRRGFRLPASAAHVLADALAEALHRAGDGS